MTTPELNIFKYSIGYTESGGKYNNDLGEYWGKYQFGDARRRDIEAMLGLPHLTREQFTPDMQEKFFSVHVQDIENKIFQNGLNKYFDKIITGASNKITAAVNKYGMIAGAHLGGFAGMKKYFTSGGAYDPADSLGTHISDYVAKHSKLAEKKTLHLT